MEGSIVVLIHSFSTFRNFSYSFRTHFVHISYIFRTFRTDFVHISYRFRTHLVKIDTLSTKLTLFRKGSVPKIQKCWFSRNKSPCGVLPNKGELFRTYPWWINSFLLWSQKVTFPNFRFFGNVLRYQVTFLPKTKMVRVVHMNIFYRMDLEIYDSKSKL